MIMIGLLFELRIVSTLITDTTQPSAYQMQSCILHWCLRMTQAPFKLWLKLFNVSMYWSLQVTTLTAHFVLCLHWIFDTFSAHTRIHESLNCIHIYIVYMNIRATFMDIQSSFQRILIMCWYSIFSQHFAYAIYTPEQFTMVITIFYC